MIENRLRLGSQEQYKTYIHPWKTHKKSTRADVKGCIKKEWQFILPHLKNGQHNRNEHFFNLYLWSSYPGRVAGRSGEKGCEGSLVMQSASFFLLHDCKDLRVGFEWCRWLGLQAGWFLWVSSCMTLWESSTRMQCWMCWTDSMRDQFYAVKKVLSDIKIYQPINHRHLWIPPSHVPVLHFLLPSVLPVPGPPHNTSPHSIPALL